MNWGVFIGVFGLATTKVLFAVAAGSAILQPWQLFIALFSGQILSVFIFTQIGSRFRKWNFQRRLRKSGGELRFNIRRVRKLYKLWKRFGLTGIAILAPLIMPPVATVIAVAFGTEPRRIYLYMATSMAIWSLLFSILGDFIHQWFHGLP